MSTYVSTAISRAISQTTLRDQGVEHDLLVDYPIPAIFPEEDDQEFVQNRLNLGTSTRSVSEGKERTTINILKMVCCLLLIDKTRAK